MSNFIILKRSEEFNYENYINNSEYMSDINEGDFSLTVLNPLDGFDLALIDQWAINLFEIQVVDVVAIKELVESSTSFKIEYDNTVPVSEVKTFTIVIESFNELTDHTDKLFQPYYTWVWNKEAGHWEPPIPYPDINAVMKCNWSNDWQNWKIDFGQPFDRHRKSFQLWLAAETDGSSMFLDACSTQDYMIKPFENITHGTRSIENLIKDYNTSIEATSELIRPYMSIIGHIVVIDLSPIALITYSECHEDAVTMFNQLYSMHPQFLARTSHELFRLIIEWAYAHTELGNEELAATTCHNILRAVQMPKDIRDGLIAMEAQQVGKFLEGSANALVEDDEDPESPVGFDRWVNTLYCHYPHLRVGQETHIDTLPASYPV